MAIVSMLRFSPCAIFRRDVRNAIPKESTVRLAKGLQTDSAKAAITGRMIDEILD